MFTNGFYKVYDVDFDVCGQLGGFILGYVATKKKRLKTYIGKHGYDDSYLDNFEFNSFGVLKNLYVEDEYRSEGYGKKLMKGILGFFEQYNVDYVFLICDLTEDNNFNLQNWYESYGFKQVGETVSGCPLMAKKMGT